VAVDGDVRKSGDAGGGLGESYLFCLTAASRTSATPATATVSFRHSIFAFHLGSSYWNIMQITKLQVTLKKIF